MVDLRRDAIGSQAAIVPPILLRSHFLWLVEQNCSISLILSDHPLDAGISQRFQNFHFTSAGRSSRAGRVKCFSIPGPVSILFSSEGLSVLSDVSALVLKIIFLNSL